MLKGICVSYQKKKGFVLWFICSLLFFLYIWFGFCMPCKLGISSCEYFLISKVERWSYFFWQKYTFGPYIMEVFSFWSLYFEKFQFSP